MILLKYYTELIFFPIVTFSPIDNYKRIDNLAIN